MNTNVANFPRIMEQIGLMNQSIIYLNFSFCVFLCYKIPFLDTTSFLDATILPGFSGLTISSHSFFFFFLMRWKTLRNTAQESCSICLVWNLTEVFLMRNLEWQVLVKKTTRLRYHLYSWYQGTKWSTWFTTCWCWSWVPAGEVCQLFPVQC